ncbi:MAG: outer membrane lipoprotein-sorting protein [bacterium]
MFARIAMLTTAAVLLLGAMLAAQDATEIMQKSHLAYYYAGDDGISDVTMTIVDKKGNERVRGFTMFRLDQADGGDQKYYTYFREPSDVRRMTFMVHKHADGQDQRWLYVPAVDLVKPISADDKNSSFVGSDFTYEDVSGRLWTEDTHTLLHEDKLGERAVWVIESKPVDPKYDGFARKVSLIDQVNYLPLREEYYDDKDELLRVFTAETVADADGFPTITVRKMEDVKKGGYTTVAFNKIDYNVGIKDDFFTERYLKNPPREYIN